MSTADRFWSHVDKSGDCWLWTGSTRRRGYGRFNVGYESIPAHRYAYELLVGPIPEGLVLDHLCRVTSCVNPAHLEPVTNRENVLRGIGITAEQARRTVCPKGHIYTEENTYTDRRGCRSCRECKAEEVAARRKRDRSRPCHLCGAHRSHIRVHLASTHHLEGAALESAVRAYRAATTGEAGQ